MVWGGNPGGDGFIDLVEFQAIAKNVKLNEDLRPDDDKVYILGTTNHANIATAAGSCNSAVLGFWHGVFINTPWHARAGNWHFTGSFRRTLSTFILVS